MRQEQSFPPYSSGLCQFIQFRVLDTDEGWNDAVLQGVYIKWLGEELKNELAAQDKTPNLEIMIALTMRLDNHRRQRQREKAV